MILISFLATLNASGVERSWSFSSNFLAGELMGTRLDAPLTGARVDGVVAAKVMPEWPGMGHTPIKLLHPDGLGDGKRHQSIIFCFFLSTGAREGCCALEVSVGAGDSLQCRGSLGYVLPWHRFLY